MIKALIFDMDGLMIDSEQLYMKVQHELADRFNRTLTREIRQQMMGRKPIESLRFFVQTLDIPITAGKMLEIRTGMIKEGFSKEIIAMPGLFHILDTYFGKLKLAVGTGSQKELMDMVVDRLNIREKFDVLQNSDDVENGKPDPEIYLKACGKLGLPPGECVVLEDSLNGIIAGKRAGCYSIAVPSEYTNDQDFSSADYIAKDLFDAADHIGHICNRIP